MHGQKIMTYRVKFKLKLFLYNILGILTNLIIIAMAYLDGKGFETLISIILFHIYTPMFEKQYHSETLFRCSIVSIVVLFIQHRVNFDVSLSMLFSVILTFLMTAISYYVRDFLDTKVLIKEYQEKLKKFEHKCLDNLTEEEMKYVMPKIKHEVIHIVYNYLHRPINQTATNFAYKNHISEATLYRYLKLVRDNYEGLS